MTFGLTAGVGVWDPFVLFCFVLLGLFFVAGLGLHGSSPLGPWSRLSSIPFLLLVLLLLLLLLLLLIVPILCTIQ